MLCKQTVTITQMIKGHSLVQHPGYLKEDLFSLLHNSTVRRGGGNTPLALLFQSHPAVQSTPVDWKSLQELQLTCLYFHVINHAAFLQLR